MPRCLSTEPTARPHVRERCSFTAACSAPLMWRPLLRPRPRPRPLSSCLFLCSLRPLPLGLHSTWPRPTNDPATLDACTAAPLLTRPTFASRLGASCVLVRACPELCCCCCRWCCCYRRQLAFSFPGTPPSTPTQPEKKGKIPTQNTQTCTPTLTLSHRHPREEEDAVN
jgi:hypothetical protein